VEEVGLVAIGRNEGEHLHQCLLSALGKVAQIVYVDSGSSDGSVELARSLGVAVVELDLTIPFTAARARNAGFDRLLHLRPQIEFVQFVDGDCEIAANWLESAHRELVAQPDLAVVCGRRRERFPEASIYNQLCDMEWDTPVGDVKACGGDAMFRVNAFQAVNGFNSTLIAGEEPELCVRLRQKGWRIFRLTAEMTLHNAQMTRFSQWWKRTWRAGYAYAEGSWLHGDAPECHWVKESQSIWLWGLLIPLLAGAMIWPTRGLSLLLFGLYPLTGIRIFLKMQSQGIQARQAALYAFSCVLGKFPQLGGATNFWRNRWLGKNSRIIEYKH
jgi:GT2 family glycosyltransferase